MGHGDIARGSAFRSATLSVIIVALVVTAAGAFCYVIVRHALYSALEAQLVEEAILFRDLYNEGGIAAVRNAVQRLEAPEIGVHREVELIDPTGARLAGTLNVAPAIIGVSRTLQVLPDRMGREYALRSILLDSSMLVVGRSVAPIRATLRRLVVALIVASGMIVLTVIATGWVMSKRSFDKLGRISRALERVSHGDLAARTGPMRGDGQIEAISALIDQSLERLSTMVEVSQNTIRAVAHDLRSPLNRAAIRLEEAAAAPPQEREELLASALDELHRVGGIFDTVLRISAIEAASGQASFKPVDLAALIDNAIGLFEADFAARRQTFAVRVADRVRVEGDEQALQQMLVNLLSNAHKHTPEGAHIVVNLRREGEETAWLTVCDDGPGIADQERTEVLKPFVRLDRSRSREGSGLGLALVQAVATRHGASVVLSDNGPGLCVGIRFQAPDELQENL